MACSESLRLPFPCYCGVPLAISAHPSGNTLQHCVDLRRACRVFTCWTTGPITLGRGLRRIIAVKAHKNFDNDPNPALATTPRRRQLRRRR